MILRRMLTPSVHLAALMRRCLVMPWLPALVSIHRHRNFRSLQFPGKRFLQNLPLWSGKLRRSQPRLWMGAWAGAAWVGAAWVGAAWAGAAWAGAAWAGAVWAGAAWAWVGG